MNYISDLLFWISNGLLVPTIVLLILCFLRALLLVGSFFSLFMTQRKNAQTLRQELDALTPETLATLGERLPTENTAVLNYYRLLLAQLDSPAQTERVLSQFEDYVENDLSLPRTLGKMGPILGLMGTLIPMGPALVGLSTGDVASMAYNMQVAFATTVVGLVIGAIGTLVLQAKKRWAAQDFANMEFIAALKAENTPSPNTSAS